MDAMNETSLLVSQVIPSHSAKSNDFFNEYGGIYSVNVYARSSICSLGTFFLKIKNVSYSNMCIRFFMHIF